MKGKMMKREETIEIARNLGWEYCEEEEQIFYRGEPCTSMLTVFARHVEQATLERAAKVCDAESFDSFERESRTRFAGDNETSHEHSIEKLAYAYVAKKVRALKDAND